MGSQKERGLLSELEAEVKPNIPCPNVGIVAKKNTKPTRTTLFLRRLSLFQM